jgi:hypothetical protein
MDCDVELKRQGPAVHLLLAPKALSGAGRVGGARLAVAILTIGELGELGEVVGP